MHDLLYGFLRQLLINSFDPGFQMCITCSGRIDLLLQKLHLTLKLLLLELAARHTVSLLLKRLRERLSSASSCSYSVFAFS